MLIMENQTEKVEANSPSFFETMKMATPDAIFGVAMGFRNDTHPDKINLGIGAYRDEEGKPWVLPVVRKAEQALLDNPNMNKEYLPMAGHAPYSTAMAKLILGKDSLAIKEGRVTTLQTLSGSGAVRVGADFMKRFHTSNVIYVSDPTWVNHMSIFGDAGLTIKKYRYYDSVTKGLDIEGMLEDLKNIPRDSMILLHVCAHNPTGVDPSPAQWEQIATICQENHLFPFFDCAYQGFVSGNVDTDVVSVRIFEAKGMELMVAQSCSKNMGLYCERAGALTFVLNHKDRVAPVASQLVFLTRPMYSTPPAHGAYVADLILNNEDMYKEWMESLVKMSQRITTARQLLYDALIAAKTPGSWEHILNQKGMFTYTGLT
eukprot:Ihof_evm1s405 gene=Ihof_evmTU1s405